jgi:transposase-like protein
MSRYSNDLRLRVINFFKQVNSDGKPISSKSETCETFGISRPTLDSWLKIDKNGSLLEIKEYKHGKTSSVNLGELKEYIDKNPDQYYHEIAKNFSVWTKLELNNTFTENMQKA